MRRRCHCPHPNRPFETVPTSIITCHQISFAVCKPHKTGTTLQLPPRVSMIGLTASVICVKHLLPCRNQQPQPQLTVSLTSSSHGVGHFDHMSLHNSYLVSTVYGPQFTADCNETRLGSEYTNTIIKLNLCRSLNSVLCGQYGAGQCKRTLIGEEQLRLDPRTGASGLFTS
ncbi:hypothetical protein J6590_026968 [Homalodisca vitripennis]|nr:hypothetical protein J6590_026968 [Homalodisca vitripennis]